MSKNTTNSNRRAYEMVLRFMRVIACNTREFDPAIHAMTWEGYKRQLVNLSAAHPVAYRAAEATMDAWKMCDFNVTPPQRFAYAVKQEPEVMGYFISAEALLSANEWLY